MVELVFFFSNFREKGYEGKKRGFVSVCRKKMSFLWFCFVL